MKKLFVAALAFAAFASCQKESTMDAALLKGAKMTFAPYAGASATRGTAIDSNTALEVKGKSFNVAAYLGNETYFGFNTVTYDGSKWNNEKSMYWPNQSSDLYFGAYLPADFTTAPAYTYDDGHSLTFAYDVKDAVSSQEDVMYALTDYRYTASTTDIDPASVNVHFKHALTQVAFTATKDDDINVSVRSIKVCNVIKGGSFVATAATNKTAANGDITTDQPSADVNTENFGTWTVGTTMQNYAAVLASDNITVGKGTKATPLTHPTDVMMLLPQALQKWDADGTDTSTDKGTESYLAIQCTITHNDGDAAIIDGTIYVPFDTKNIPYSASSTEDTWKPGYKITYNLAFGGGYTIPEKPNPTDPEPGETPDPEEVVPTLRAIKYTVTVDEWIPVADVPVVGM